MASQLIPLLDNKDFLCLTVSKKFCEQGVYGGHKREFITQQLSEMEETLLVCSVCAGVTRDACSIKGGSGMVCEACVQKTEEFQAVEPVRSMVSNLKCRCPLKHRGLRFKSFRVGISSPNVSSRCLYFLLIF